MKKILAILAGLMLLSSCDSGVNLPEANVKFTKMSKQKDLKFYIIKYEFEGHKYQFHSFYLGNLSGEGGPVHDPDCPCLNNDSIKNDTERNSQTTLPS